MDNIIDNSFRSHLALVEDCQVTLKKDIKLASELIEDSLRSGGKIMLFGNGGSAGDAQHIAAEFTGRFLVERKGLPAIALTTDTSAITAISNDYGYPFVFARQVEALARPGDILIGISTSGNSENVNRALEVGAKMGTINIGFSGKSGGKMTSECRINIIVPSTVTARIQEMHILIGHILCEYIDCQYVQEK